MATNPIWIASANVVAGAVIIDPNGNVQQAQNAGQSGASAPTFAAVIGVKTSDGGVSWMCVAVLAAPAATPGPNLPSPSFVNDADGLDPNLILADMIAAFQAASGRTLQPAQVERLLIDLYAYRESLVRNAIQYAAQQNLLAFAAFPMLDYLGALVGVTRLPAQAALCTIQFTLAAAQNQPVTIPAGTQVGTSDGNFIFATRSALTIPAGSTTGSVAAAATVAGAAGNGYLAGQVNVMLAPNALVSAAANTNTTSGGGDAETDAHLRARIQAAPNLFTVAGPNAQYRAFALGVDPSIIDAQVVSPNPGQVNVYILTGPITAQPAASPNSAGIAGGALLAKVLAALSADAVRPLTDTVNVYAVAEIDYTIVGTVELYADADPTSTMAAVNAAAQNLAILLASRVQRDIVPEEIIAALGSIAGVYRVTLTSPVYTQLSSGQWANCTAITLTQTSATETM